MGPGTPSKRQLFIAAASVSALLVSRSALADFNVVGADIPELENAYATDETTVTDVVQQYLNRIAEYNLPNAGGINAVFEVNPNILSEAEAEDTMIADGATEAQYPLLGVPVLVKGSYDVAGLITDNGVSILAGGEGSNTPGETTLIPTTNAFSVQQLIDAGALIIGKSNMSTMAYSYDGIDNAGGAVVNPFNPLRIPGGSSSGIGAGISANFAMLGMGGETGGSIRVPSDADGDVGLKTSAGLIDPGGTWPLTPSRDVVGPIAKDVTDIAYAMNALVAPSPTNLWNNTPYYPTSEPGSVRPADYTSFLQTTALEGKVIAVPNSMTGVGTQYEGTESPIVLAAFNNALTVMQNEGATIVHVNIPASVLYYSTIGSSGAGTPATTTGFPYPYPTTTVGGTVPATAWSNDAAAYYYEKQIESYHDPVIKNLQDFANALQAGANLGAGSPFSTLKSAASNIKSLAAIYEAGQAAGFESTNGVPDNPNAIEALQGLTDLRNAGINDFMADPGIAGISHIDAFAAPTYGTVVSYVTSKLLPPNTPPDPFAGSGSASLLGRLEGNILGLPSISVPMGYASDGTPMGLQFFDQLDGEGEIIGDAYAYEQATHWRMDPSLSFVPDAAFDTGLPEPTGAAVMVLGGVLLAARRRRRSPNEVGSPT